ncbi:MAG: NAD(P)-dependent oxidoreductase [Pleurocapsa sp. MO_192.B19]|nr:NAD(P)-dependent oxidoreductase [Pleurocapsa sp. MO_192.B19]
MSKITVLGMGAMGSRMALSLLKAEHEVTVWNRRAGKTDLVVKAGAKVAETPRSAVKEADFVISMVRDDEASKQVWLNSETGAMAGLSKNVIGIESSTLTVAWTKELAKEFKQKGVAFLDAPVAGTRPQAEAAKLIYFVGGDAATFTKAQPILQAMGSAVHSVGSVGSGMTIKLAVNALFGIQVSALGELIGLMHDCGLDEAKAVEILSSTPVCSPAAKMAASAMLVRNFSPLFPIELVEKDLSYAVKTAQSNQTTLPLVEAAQQVFATAIKEGYGEDNITGVAQLYI